MDRSGGLPGGVIAEVRNLHSRRLYVVSTAPELGKDYWSTVIMPAEEKRSFLGLSKRIETDFYHPITNFIRNNKKDAYEVHAYVRHIVATMPEGEWLGAFPSQKPPDGFSPDARTHLAALDAATNSGPVARAETPDNYEGPPRTAQEHAERLYGLVTGLPKSLFEPFERELSLYLPEGGMILLKARFQQFGDAMVWANLVHQSRDSSADPRGYFRDLLDNYHSYYMRMCGQGDPDPEATLKRMRLEFIMCSENPVDYLTQVAMAACFIPSASSAVRERVRMSAELMRDVVAGAARDPMYFERHS